MFLRQDAQVMTAVEEQSILRYHSHAPQRARTTITNARFNVTTHYT